MRQTSLEAVIIHHVHDAGVQKLIQRIAFIAGDVRDDAAGDVASQVDRCPYGWEAAFVVVIGLEHLVPSAAGIAGFEIAVDDDVRINLIERFGNRVSGGFVLSEQLIGSQVEIADVSKRCARAAPKNDVDDADGIAIESGIGFNVQQFCRCRLCRGCRSRRCG